MMSRPSFTTRSLATAALALALGLTACSVDDEGQTSDPGTPAPSTIEPATVPASLPDPTADLTATTWLTDTGVFADLPLADADVEDWPELFAGLTDASGPLPVSVTTRVERDPDACTLWRVLVEDASFGEGPADERMRTTVLETLTDVDHDPGPLLSPEQDPWCGDRERQSLAWYATVVTPAFCELPDGDPLQCLTITTMRCDGGAHPNTVHTDLVFDAATGGPLDVSAILATRGVDLEAATAFVESTVCDLDVASGLLEEDDGCWPIVLRNARPSPTGLILSFAPYESGPYAFGPRDLFVPWAELDAGAAVPAAARSAQRELRGALASGDWSQVYALVPADGEFLVASGEEAADPVAVLRALPRDPRPELLIALMQRPGRIDGVTGTVWPELAVRDPFVIDDAERPDLEAAFGAEAVAAWESAGRYLGWRAGFDDDGTWRFVVAGD
jgi:hypothetical protein